MKLASHFDLEEKWNLAVLCGLLQAQ